MTDKTVSMRGYDDSPYLKEMADGIVVRRFASVDEAAKSVLNEEAGSNVDRLRRKFREQNWYERGLNDYVEAEINRRASVDADDASIVEGLTSSNCQMAKEESVVATMQRKLAEEIAATPVLGFFTAGVAAALAVVELRPVSTAPIFAACYMVSMCSLMSWGRKAAAKATPIQARVHLAFMVSFFIAVIGCLKFAVPDPSFTTGSLPGAMLLGFSTFVIANYVAELVTAYARRTGRRKSPEILALSTVILGIALSGFLPLANDLSSAVKRIEQASMAQERVADVYNDLQKRHPGIDLEPLVEVQKKIVEDSVGFKYWFKD
jgi:hypothetical protein